MMKSDVEPARLQANFKTRVTDFGRGESSIMWVRSKPVIRIDLCSLFERNAGKVLPGSALLATIDTLFESLIFGTWTCLNSLLLGIKR